MKKKIYAGNEYMDAVEKIKKMYKSMLLLNKDDLEYANKLAYQLCKNQQEDGSWKVYNEKRIESDCMIAYGYIPTYYAAAALIHLSNISEAFSYENELKEAIKFITFDGARISFPGHGFDAERDQLRALNIFKEAGLYRFLRNHGYKYESLSNLITKIINKYREDIVSGNTYGGFGENFKVEYEKEIEDYEMSCSEEVWYVAYGSNLCFSRFKEYIELCSNKTLPTENMKYVIPHDIYFAYSSSRWGRKGVAFLDDCQPGKAYGRAYKIKMDQFYDIMTLEGGIYNKKVCLGVLNGVPVYTFTANKKRVDTKEPSAEYINVIMNGLLEIYSDKAPLSLEMYLYDKCILNDIDKSVLGYIRNSEHGVSLGEIATANVSGEITKTRNAIKKLLLHNLIKQDSLNKREGHTLESREAVFYTQKEKRTLIDLITLYS